MAVVSITIAGNTFAVSIIIVAISIHHFSRTTIVVGVTTTIGILSLLSMVRIVSVVSTSIVIIVAVVRTTPTSKPSSSLQLLFELTQLRALLDYKLHVRCWC